MANLIITAIALLAMLKQPLLCGQPQEPFYCTAEQCCDGHSGHCENPTTAGIAYEATTVVSKYRLYGTIVAGIVGVIAVFTILNNSNHSHSSKKQCHHRKKH